MNLRPVPRMVRCSGCSTWLRPAEWGIPADLALIDPVAQVVLCETCAGRAAEKVAEAAERRRR